MAFRPLADLRVEDVDCKVRVRVLRMWDVKQNGYGESVLRKMMIVDAAGYEMEVVIHRISFPRFGGIMREGAVYRFANFLVQRNTTAFRVTAPDFRIVLLPDSVCEEMVDSEVIPKFSFRFLKTDQFEAAFQNRNYLSDLVGQLVQSQPAEQLGNDYVSIKKKDLHIRLTDGEVVKVIVWDSIVDQLELFLEDEPETGVVLILTSAIVHKYHGEYYFSSSRASKLYGNLHYPDGHDMLDFSDNGVPRKVGEICQSFIVPSSIKLLEDLNVDGPLKGVTYKVTAEVSEVNAYWSDRKKSFMVELKVKDEHDSCDFIFTSNSFRSMTDSIFKNDLQFERSSFDVNLKSMKGKKFQFSVKSVPRFYNPEAVHHVVVKISSG
ncbi:unnamed protein product [Linum trigynum]|uniref:Replication protein A 70 kDa DNA-binding subunit B/D first OB fold domain-containing protein n=1 Tax=Linum trigynum TaxID=586398 RepID=A0AAV2DAG8_9ROSI